jgi:DUF1680 family protein
MYCAEWADNNGQACNFIVSRNTQFATEYKNDLLNGVTVMKGEATAVVIDKSGNNVTTVKQPLVAIPYYAWAHRGKGEMTVWFPEKVTNVDLISR